MSQIVEGRFFPLKEIGASFSTSDGGTTRYLTITTQAEIQMFERFIVQERDIAANELNLYSSVPVGRNGKARFANLSTPAHLFSKRKNGCSWSPKGRIRTNITEFGLCPIEYDGEQCTDVLWNSCWESILGKGLDVYDWFATEEGRTMVAGVLRQTHAGLGNSFSELVNFANHPLIDQVNSLGSYAVTPAEWDDFYDQQMGDDCAGLITQIDAMRGKGHEAYNIDIPDASFNAEGAFTGDILALMQSLRMKAKGDFKTWIRTGMRTPTGQILWPIVMLTSALYEAFEEHIVALHGDHESGFQYLFTRSNGQAQLLPGVLRYKNMPVVRWDEIDRFDAITGCVSHRAAIVAPGVLGISHDTDSLEQFTGMGMRMVQKLDPPDKGKLFQWTTKKWGAAIGDVDFLVHASNVSLPA